ncbi:MAG: carbohydrate-binding domain-containing protein [Pseudoclavibacter sp.]|nr:carbohydrate-binding domain-containing protein [Pseudoclavibacter sp.]
MTLHTPRRPNTDRPARNGSSTAPHAPRRPNADRRTGPGRAILLLSTLLLAGAAAVHAPAVRAAAEETGQATAGNDPALVVEAPDPAGAVPVELAGAQARPAGPGVHAAPGLLRITRAGAYLLRGDYTGTVRIEVPERDDVVLILANAAIEPAQGPAIEALEGRSLAILYAEASVNRVRAGAAAGPGHAAIRSAPALTLGGGFAGSGSLRVEAPGADGVVADGSLALTGGSLAVEAGGDALRSAHSVTLSAPRTELRAEGAGVVAASEDPARGYLDVHGGALEVRSGADGLSATGDAIVRDGSLRVASGGGADAQLADGGRASAVRAGDALELRGGSLELDAAEHGLTAAGPLSLRDGRVQIAASDKGLDSRTGVWIEGGALGVSRSYEGIEAPRVTVSGGVLHIASFDDALNVSRAPADGGLGDSGVPEPDAALIVSGGELTLMARDDCIDSNGTLEISGGTLMLVGPESEGYGALIDSDDAFTLSGGRIDGAGRAALSVDPSPDSGQGWLAARAHGPAGAHVQILDPSGAVLADYRSHRSFQEVFHSSPAVQPGARYTVLVDGAAAGEAIAGRPPTGDEGDES